MIDVVSRHCQTAAWLALGALWTTAAAAAEYRVEIGTGVLRHDGYLQTPAGGAPGSTDLERPTFAELNLDGGNYRWLAGAVEWRRRDDEGAFSVAGVPVHLLLRIRYEQIGDEAETVLATPLRIWGRTLPAGDSVRSEVSFDGFSLALTGVFNLADGVTAELGAGAAWTAYDFFMVSPRHHAERAYHVNSIGLVGSLAKDLGQGWRLEAVLRAFPALDGTGSSYLVEPRIRRRLTERATLVLAAPFEWFRYDDAHKQEMPNRLNVRRRVVPSIAIGLDL